ncbi:MAG: hypothetical protein R6V42_09720 [Orrella sp.]
MVESNPQYRAIHQQVLRAIALDRTPGYHFCGNFLGLHFDGLEGNQARVTLPTTPWVTDDQGHIDPFAMGVLIDFALANAVRTAVVPEARLATVSLNLQLTGEPLVGDLTAHAELEGFFAQATGKLGMTRGRVFANGKVVAYGSATFMVLPAPKGKTLYPVPWIYRPVPQDLPPLDMETLSETEQWILARSQATLASLEPTETEASSKARAAFLEAFLGIEMMDSEQGSKVTIPNGPHVGNRVGHVQGGISLGLALYSANRALSKDWRCSGINASYVSPGMGAALASESVVTHRGRLTAVGRTQVKGDTEKVVLDVMTHHVRGTT